MIDLELTFHGIAVQIYGIGSLIPWNESKITDLMESLLWICIYSMDYWHSAKTHFLESNFPWNFYLIRTEIDQERTFSVQECTSEKKWTTKTGPEIY